MKAFSSVLAGLSLSLASADQVVVLSNAPSAFHSTSSTTFSAQALTQLMLNVFGLSSGSVVSLAEDDLSSSLSTSAADSPLEADLFQSLAAQSTIVINGAFDATELASKQFHGKWFPLKAEETSVISALPTVVANELKQDDSSSVLCSGPATLCTNLDHVEPTKDQVDAFLKSQNVLQSSNQQELALAKELAGLDALTKKLQQQQEKALHNFFVVGISPLDQVTDASKRQQAQQLIKERVLSFAKVLDAKFPNQMSVNVVVSEKFATKQLDQVVSFGRMLLQADAPLINDTATNATAVMDDSDPFYQPSMDEIERYQVALWTTVLLVAILFLAILALCNMDNTRDSLLYAKFITDASHRKMD